MSEPNGEKRQNGQDPKDHRINGEDVDAFSKKQPISDIPQEGGRKLPTALETQKARDHVESLYIDAIAVRLKEEFPVTTKEAFIKLIAASPDGREIIFRFEKTITQIVIKYTGDDKEPLDYTADVEYVDPDYYGDSKDYFKEAFEGHAFVAIVQYYVDLA